MGPLVMTLVVRDEEEVLAANLDYHLAQGVDVILVVDHGSTDSTPEILADYATGGRVRVWREEERAHLQAARVNRLLGIAAREHDAAWVIHGDADEFWMPGAGCLRDVFAAVPERYGYLRAPRHDFVSDGQFGGSFHQKMVLRRSASTHIYGNTLLPKLAQRSGAGAGVDHGNHNLLEPRLPPAPEIGAIEVLHFQMRNFEQYEHKVLKLGQGLEAVPDRPPTLGVEGLELLAVQRRGELRRFFDSRLLGGEALARALDQGELQFDYRLQRFMASGPRAVPESAPIQHWLRRLWEGQEAAAAANDRRAELEAEVGRLRQALVRIQGSRTMRYSTPARRLYHRLRERER